MIADNAFAIPNSHFEMAQTGATIVREYCIALWNYVLGTSTTEEDKMQDKIIVITL